MYLGNRLMVIISLTYIRRIGSEEDMKIRGSRLVTNLICLGLVIMILKGSHEPL
jgi:hypothetical protein